MRNRATLFAVVGIPLAIGAWAAFRPELLFVNQKVNESGPAQAMKLRTGNFESYAHETKGMATILESGNKFVLRLSDFTTSNGPDVHVLLSKTDNPQDLKGSLDLGSIKGNEGNQNYELPAGTDPSQYNSVTIWCKRFDVSFGGAKLAKSVAAAFDSGFTLASYDSEIMVTGGKFRGLKGMAEIVEKNDKRYLKVMGLKPAANQRLWLLKEEDAKTTGQVKSAIKVDLGSIKPGVAYYPLSKDIDVWLYRTAAVWDTKAKSTVATAPLRSAQEKPAKQEATALNLDLFA